MNLVIIQNDDGWDDAAAENAERVIKGTLLKFNDWRWTKGKEGTEVEEGTALVALGTAAAWVKWRDGKPIEYVCDSQEKNCLIVTNSATPKAAGLGKSVPTASRRTLAEHALRLLRRPGQCRSIHVRPPRAGVVARLSMIWPSKSRGYVTGNRGASPLVELHADLG